MSENKKASMSAFLNKNKKAKKTKASEETQAASQQLVNDADPKTTEQASKNTPVANQDSSDEEVDELEIANKQLNYANIKETNHSADNKAGDEKKLGFGFEEKKKADEVAPLTRQPKKFGDGQINFSRPTKFSNKKTGGKLGEGFEEGLDDIDDDGKFKKKDQKNRADGQREFINLGSSIRVAGDKEEEKEERRATGIKPTFKGKLNLTKTGAQKEEQSEGVSKAYDFGVVYKQDRPEGERRERMEGEDNRFGAGQRKNRERGQAFGAQKEGDSDGDDGFEIVRNKDRKVHKKKSDSDSSDDEKPSGFRGGRGGFHRGGSRGVGGLHRRTEGEGEQIRGARVTGGGNRGRGDRGGFRND